MTFTPLTLNPEKPPIKLKLAAYSPEGLVVTGAKNGFNPLTFICRLLEKDWKTSKTSWPDNPETPVVYFAPRFIPPEDLTRIDFKSNNWDNILAMGSFINQDPSHKFNQQKLEKARTTPQIMDHPSSSLIKAVYTTDVISYIAADVGFNIEVFFKCLGAKGWTMTEVKHPCGETKLSVIPPNSMYKPLPHISAIKSLNWDNTEAMDSFIDEAEHCNP